MPRNDGEASAPRTASPSASAPGFALYVSPGLSYSFQYPAGWTLLPLGHDGSHYTQDLVSENTASPENLSASGIWLNIQVDTQPTQACVISPTTDPSVTTREVVLDGSTSTEHVSSRGIEGPYVLHGGWCYKIGFITLSAAAVQQHTGDVERIYSSFRFNR